MADPDDVVHPLQWIKDAVRRLLLDPRQVCRMRVLGAVGSSGVVSLRCGHRLDVDGTGLCEHVDWRAETRERLLFLPVLSPTPAAVVREVAV